MSWGVGPTTGKPAKVKEVLAEQFERVKKQVVAVPHEVESVETVEKLVNSELDFAVANGVAALTVSAGGSCNVGATDGSYKGSTSVKVSVEPIYGFVE